MRPERKREASSKATVAHARMYMKSHLGWLCGFPVGQSGDSIEWACFCLERPARIEHVRISRNELRRAHFGMTTLTRRFPRALPEIVSDVDAWTNRVAGLFERLKDRVHHAEMLLDPISACDPAYPADFMKQAAALRREWPRLRSFIEAIAWVFYLFPKESIGSLDWVEKSAPQLSIISSQSGRKDDYSVLLALWSIARHDGNGRVSSLLRLLADERAYIIPTEGLNGYRQAWMAKDTYAFTKPFKQGLLSQKERHGELLARPEATLGPNLLAFVDWVVSQPAATRRSALELLEVVVPKRLLELCEDTWSTIEGAVRRAARVRNASLFTDDRWARREGRDRIRAVVKGLKDMAGRLMPRIHDTLLLTAICKASEPRNPAVARQLHSALQSMPELDGKQLVRPAMLVGLFRMVSSGNCQMSDAPELIRIIEKYFVKHGEATGVLMPWSDCLSAWNSIEDRTAGCSPSTAFDSLAGFASLHDVRLSLDVCARVYSEYRLQRTLTPRDMDVVGHVVTRTQDVNQSVDFFCAAERKKIAIKDYGVDIVVCAIDLAADPDDFCRLLCMLEHYRWHNAYQFRERVERLLKDLASVGGRDLLVAFLEDAAWHSLEELEKQRQLIRELGSTAPILSRNPILAPPQWTTKYPTCLRGSLAELTAVTSDAERIASQILDRHFRGCERLANDIAVTEELISRRPDDGRLAKRLENLKERQLMPPRQISSARLARLKSKIHHRVLVALVKSWRQQADNVLKPLLFELLQLDAVPDYLAEEDCRKLLVAIAQLEPQSRELGLRLLRDRGGSPPWISYDQPVNRQFIHRLRSHGICVEPWLSPDPPTVMKGGDNKRLHLAFETDPLEILRMGHYFGTCLSPGGACFNSAVANAVDVNKRVLFGRDSHGKVVARCLMALTDSGEIVAFHPYCYDPSLGFSGMVSRFAVDLAGRMRTTVVCGGHISRLVAPAWLDDGPIDICDHFECLKEDSSFRRALREIPLDQFVGKTEAALEPLPLNDLTIPKLLELDELDARPELVIPLLPHIDKCRRLDTDALLRALECVRKAGPEEVVGRFVLTHVPRHLARSERHHWYGSTIELLTSLVEVNPSAALRVLRSTRPKGVRSDEDERNLSRRKALARAHSLLGRGARAERLSSVAGPQAAAMDDHLDRPECL